MPERESEVQQSERLSRPWLHSDRPVPRLIVRPLERFLELESGSAALLMAAAVVALVWVKRLRVLLRGSLDDRVALLHDAGLLGPDTVIATTVHALQVLDEDLPAAEHDFQVDVIVTPDQIMSCQTARPRSGVRWQNLPPSYLDAIPALGALSRTQTRSTSAAAC